jgi:pilus assembly protein CpaE
MPVADARFCKTLLICPNRSAMTEAAPLLAAALPLAPIQKLTAFPDRKTASELFRTFEAKLCFLDFASPGHGGFATLEILQAISPDLIVVALLSANNPELVLRCLRAGAADFLVSPFTPDQVESVVEKVVRRIPAAQPEGPPARVIAVMPVKGSTGATTIACNLAFQCKRLGANRVLLADLDGLTGVVSFVLKLKSNFSFLDVLQHTGVIDDDIWRQMVMPLQGIDVLLAPDAAPDPVADLPTAAPIFDFVRYSYDVIVADCGGPAGAWNLSVAQAADEVLLVTTNELPDLHAAQRALIYLEAHEVDADRLRLVVNRYAEPHGLGREAIASTLRKDVYHFLPADAASTERCLMDGKPVKSGTPLGKELATLAARLLELERTEAAPRTGKGLLSFLSRR